jgi:hypothetical protein
MVLKTITVFCCDKFSSLANLTGFSNQLGFIFNQPLPRSVTSFPRSAASTLHNTNHLLLAILHAFRPLQCFLFPEQ